MNVCLYSYCDCYCNIQPSIQLQQVSKTTLSYNSKCLQVSKKQASKKGGFLAITWNCRSPQYVTLFKTSHTNDPIWCRAWGCY